MTSPSYVIPAEIADHCLKPSGHADLVRLMMRGARPEPLAMLRILNGGWVVRYAFKEPVRTPDGVVDHFQATLAVHPEGHLG
jgi:hypothetical protein